MAHEKKGFDQQIIRDLAALLRETDLTEIEIENDDLRVRVSRAAPAQKTIQVEAPARPAEPARTGEGGGKPEGEPARLAGAVPSPMVGTTYRSSSPGSKPFVEVGDAVKKGQTILIIEAMKHMNEVPAPHAGTVMSVLVEDGQPAEFGEPLMIIA